MIFSLSYKAAIINELITSKREEMLLCLLTLIFCLLLFHLHLLVAIVS